VIAVSVSAQPSSTPGGTGVVPVNDPGVLPGTVATAVAVSSTCASVGVFPGDVFDFPQVPVTSAYCLLAHSDRQLQPAIRQIDGVS
jgi:hypothetical protein